MNILQRLSLAWRILTTPDGNLMRHARREFEVGGPPPPNMPDYIIETTELSRIQMLELLLVFSSQRHSGASAAAMTAGLHTLLQFQPLIPLRGTDDEWMLVGGSLESPDGALYQNIRASRVFKVVRKGQPDDVYDINGKVFREPSGSCYTSVDSRTPVTFPYRPLTQIVDVPGEEPEQERRGGVPA